MEKELERHINRLIEQYPMLYICRNSILDAYHIMEECYEHDGKLLVAGNGGSAADSEHIVGELMKRFRLPRAMKRAFSDRLISVNAERGSLLAKTLEGALMAIPLVGHEALMTAYINDVGASGIFAQQLLGYGRKGDVFWGISTSGNADNILNAAVVAHAIGIKVIGLTGGSGGGLVKMADAAIVVPETETYRIQELHLPVYHCLCLMLEEHFFSVD